MKDNLKEKFEKTEKAIFAINNPVSIIENGTLKTEFVANGTKYRVMSPDKVFNIGRQTAYYNINTAFGMCQSPTQIKKRFNDNLSTILQLMRAKGSDWERLMEKLLRDALNNVDSFKGEFTSKYPIAYYLCTLFIIKEGEDLTTWSFEQADNKIADWVSANIAAVDFFSIARHFSTESQETLSERSQKNQKQDGGMSGVSEK